MNTECVTKRLHSQNTYTGKLQEIPQFFTQNTRSVFKESRTFIPLHITFHHGSSSCNFLPSVLLRCMPFYHIESHCMLLHRIAFHCAGSHLPTCAYASCPVAPALLLSAPVSSCHDTAAALSPSHLQDQQQPHDSWQQWQQQHCRPLLPRTAGLPLRSPGAHVRSIK